MLKARGIQVATREAVTFKDGKGIFVAGPKEQDGTKRYESVLIANVAGMTALVSVQMLESSRATVTDAVVRDAFKTIAVRQQIPEAERLAVLPYKIGELCRLPRRPQRTRRRCGPHRSARRTRSPMSSSRSC